MTPDTSAYMILGYVFFFVVMSVYLLSLALRWRNLKEELELLRSEREKE
ncbi:MAG: hypothetical protein ACK8QZ_00080 [Anaerolineales bacterium]